MLIKRGLLTPVWRNTDFIKVNYDQPIEPIVSGWEGEDIYIVDFSIPVDLMRKLQDKNRVVWIDHHMTSIEAYKDYDRSIDGVRHTGLSGCMLTWAWINGWHEQMIKDPAGCVPLAPKFTQYIHLWDVFQWDNRADANEINQFITALESMPNEPHDHIWQGMCDNGIDEMVEAGKNMIIFRSGYACSVCNSIGTIIEWEGYLCYAVNMPKTNSEWFTCIPPGTCQILMPFYYNIEQRVWVVSLYSTDNVWVSSIAKKYGGGGHIHAAGFTCKKLPFLGE